MALGLPSIDALVFGRVPLRSLRGRHCGRGSLLEAAGICPVHPGPERDRRELLTGGALWAMAAVAVGQAVGQAGRKRMATKPLDRQGPLSRASLLRKDLVV